MRALCRGQLLCEGATGAPFCAAKGGQVGSYRGHAGICELICSLVSLQAREPRKTRSFECRNLPSRDRFSPDSDTEKPMTQIKRLGAALILSAAVVTPVFAQDARVLVRGSRYGVMQLPRPFYGRSCIQGPGFA